MKLVYIVDDEPNIRNLVALGLQDEGFTTREFACGGDLLTAIAQKVPDVLVLDWMLPPPDGRALCKLLRDDPITRALPIIMLTAKSDEVDRILGLEFGADDYLTKPFSVRELAARVRALLRRGEYAAPQGSMSAEGIVLDEPGRQVSKHGQPIELTLKEFDLLAMLMRSSGKVLTRDMLLDGVWGISYYGDTRTVDVHIRYLRQKIEDEPDRPKLIQTVRGVGYRFCAKT